MVEPVSLILEAQRGMGAEENRKRILKKTKQEREMNCVVSGDTSPDTSTSNH